MQREQRQPQPDSHFGVHINLAIETDCEATDFAGTGHRDKGQDEVETQQQ